MAILDRISEIGERFQELCSGKRRDKEVKFTHYLEERLITSLDASDKSQVIKQLTNLLEKEGKLKEPEEFLNAIEKRERLVSTGVGMGVAVPHAKLEGYNDFFVAVATIKNGGIDWDALDELPVKIVFMIGGPDDRQNEYLGILQLLTQAIKNGSLRNMLSSGKLLPNEVIDLFKEAENGSHT